MTRTSGTLTDVIPACAGMTSVSVAADETTNEDKGVQAVMLRLRASFRAKAKCIAIFAALSILLPILVPGQSAFAAPKGSRWGADYFPNFQVVSHDGRTFNFYDDLIKDKIVVVNFIYTSCPDICGLQTARMAQVYDRLKDIVGSKVFFYSISMDPENDSPSKLRGYATAFNTGPGWLFLTGKPQELKLIRHKLGDRSRKLTEHRNDAMLGNDRTGEWARASVMANLDLLAQDIRDMDPAHRARKRKLKLQYAKTGSFKLGNQAGSALFMKACSSCHSIGGGKRVGPDLKGVTARRDRNWLIRYLIDPQRMRAVRDPIAISLAKRFPGVVMPYLGLSKNDASDLISYLGARTKQHSAMQIQEANARKMQHENHRGSH